MNHERFKHQLGWEDLNERARADYRQMLINKFIERTAFVMLGFLSAIVGVLFVLNT